MIRAKQDKTKNLKKYYHPDLKEEFINTYKDGNTKDYSWNSIFSRSAVMEEIRDKDVCNFTYEEIERLLISFRSTSTGRLSVILTILRAYTDFCIERNFSLDNQNHFREIISKNLINYIDKRKAELVFIKEEEIKRIVRESEAYRDKFLVLGLFNGIVGDKYEDLIELDTKDLLGNNQIIIRRTGEIRSVDPELYEIMEKASEEYKIPVENGSVWGATGSKIFKPIASKKAKIKADKPVIDKRLAKIRVLQRMPMFGPKNIIQSGFCNKVLRYMKTTNCDVKGALKSPYIQQLRIRYLMPKTDASCIKIIENYKLFTENDD